MVSAAYRWLLCPRCNDRLRAAPPALLGIASGRGDDQGRTRRPVLLAAGFGHGSLLLSVPAGIYVVSRPDSSYKRTGSLWTDPGDFRDAALYLGTTNIGEKLLRACFGEYRTNPGTNWALS